MSTPPRRDLSNLGQGLGQLGGKLALALVLVGLIVIAVAYEKVSALPNLIAQFPYLLSGGLIGLSLVILGSALLVVQGARADRARLEAKLDEVVEALGRGAGGGASAGPAGGAGAVRAPALPDDASGLVLAGSASYHLPGCRLVDGREEVSYLTRAEARARVLTACRVCRPEAQPTAPQIPRPVARPRV